MENSMEIGDNNSSGRLDQVFREWEKNRSVGGVKFSGAMIHSLSLREASARTIPAVFVYLNLTLFSSNFLSMF